MDTKAEDTDTIDPAHAGSLNELGEAAFAPSGGPGDFSKINPRRIEQITPERQARVLSFRASQAAAKAAREASLETLKTKHEAQKLGDKLRAERAKHYPPLSPIQALRAVQEATRRRSR